ncbi:MAG: RecX family transcriptional regulator [Sphingomonadales bacterium]|nr:RecX family transcriptional regulator [Sphingomonadales bacterium]MDE2568836.1 RecX family transcriptional regulator [Sphingomonadales bacterium]
MDDRPQRTGRREARGPAAARRERRARPLDAARLDELALAYVARFATSAGKLSAYLSRKLRERGWEGEGAPDPAAIVERMVRAGYVDDAAYARAKGAGLLRRGYGERRVEQALRAAGIGEDLRHEVRASEGERRRAALALARKRGFGPFGREALDPARREKQIAAMLRAGHPLECARELVDAVDMDAATGWADEAEDD